MFFSVASLPVFLGLSIAVDEPVPLLLPFIVFMAGLAWRVYSALFGEDTPVAQKQGKDTARFGRRDAPSLEAPRSAPASWQSTQRTTELSQPPSVTEQTTTLLDQDRPSSST